MKSELPEIIDVAPFFITGPGESDILLIAMIVFTLVMVLLIGVFYLYLHALPERMAHRANGTQLQIVSILALLALFTQHEIFWIAALLIVAVRVPDFITPITSIAQSLRYIAGADSLPQPSELRPMEGRVREDDEGEFERNPTDTK